MTLLFLGLMLSGTFALGVGDVLKKKYMKEGLDDQVLLVISLFFTGMLLLPLLLLVGMPEIKDGFWMAMLITVLLNLVSQNLFIRAFKLSDASLIAPLRLIIPPLVIVTGFLFLREKPSLVGAMGIFVSMLGLWLLLKGGKAEGEDKPRAWFKDRGVLYGLAGSVLFSISFPFDKIAVVNSSTLFATWLMFTALGSVTFLIHSIRNRQFPGLVAASFTQHFKANMLVSLCSSIGIGLTNHALNYSFAAYASSLKRLQVLWTVIIAGRFLKEKEMPRRIMATVIMFIGIALSVFWK